MSNYQSKNSDNLNSTDIKYQRLITFRRFVEIIVSEKVFLILLTLAFVFAAIVFNRPEIARWTGFVFASYAVVSNDSIQTIGTFIASNKHRRWWVIWIFIATVFLGTVTYSFLNYNGDVSYGRLASKGFETTPSSFTYLHLVAPLILLVLTRLKMPVSTTFLILSCFATSGTSIAKVITKSLSGYVIAFLIAIVLWRCVTPVTKRVWKGKPNPGWNIAQWITTGTLWSVWLMQDAANVAVFLPRSMQVIEFVFFCAIITIGLAFLFYRRGDKIQSIVDEKSDIIDVRAATIVDLVYACILYYFKILSSIPMSTTWVFLGLLAGREYGLLFAKNPETPTSFKNVCKIVIIDLGKASLGLIISLALALAINPNLASNLPW